MLSTITGQIPCLAVLDDHGGITHRISFTIVSCLPRGHSHAISLAPQQSQSPQDHRCQTRRNCGWAMSRWLHWASLRLNLYFRKSLNRNSAARSSRSSSGTYQLPALLITSEGSVVNNEGSRFSGNGSVGRRYFSTPEFYLEGTSQKNIGWRSQR